MIVAASTDCFADCSLKEALDRLVDLEYQNVEICIHAGGQQLTPAEVANDLERTIARCQDTRRLDVVAYSAIFSDEGEEMYRQFAAICKLAKATKVVSVTVPSGELGTPFNEEVERLRKLVAIASPEGVLVSIKTELGRLSEDPDTVVVLCDNVKGLGVTYDPSHFIFSRTKEPRTAQLMKYVYHVLLRDTSETQMQVRVGQGKVDYSKLMTQLQRLKYNRAFSVDIKPLPDIDHSVELRKMRLLMDSLT